MDTLIFLHSKLHHSIYLLAALSLVFPLLALVKKTPISSLGMGLIRTYSIVITIQLLIGISQLIMRWSDFGEGLRYRLEHATLMIVAVALVHMAPRFVKRGDTAGNRNALLMLLGSLVLVLLGVSLIQRAIAGA
ncbi:MAG: hypothetical protein FJ211_08350 [Ignavibacteria bacterium]|nr:hypothetical protein [Ignavibacteria bacterium]